MIITTDIFIQSAREILTSEEIDWFVSMEESEEGSELGIILADVQNRFGLAYDGEGIIDLSNPNETAAALDACYIMSAHGNQEYATYASVIRKLIEHFSGKSLEELVGEHQKRGAEANVSWISRHS
ncbi:hypothetical protein CWD94_12645 [Lysinibacillus xylanilyticus]|uniref:Uncharacterized protein n=2 Tax=Lysinibacillus xylanilyticus TaxID=582475 RepID=A0A2M9Q5N8_9BACI|nr:hypothetical protein CWD94_12645 [Lysinibacillus xylanilyticus]